MDSPKEQNLLKGARNFDLTTLGEIYDLYSSGIYRYALRLLGDDCLAEDCVADTFERFLKALSAKKGPQDHLQAYLYRIAHNWITDTYRRNPPPTCELDDSFKDNGQKTPEDSVEQMIAKQQIRQSLQALTPDQRQVIVLRFIEGWENEAVAQAVNKPVGAVKALQHRALVIMRKRLLR